MASSLFENPNPCKEALDISNIKLKAETMLNHVLKKEVKLLYI
jgi:hypothetical protein